LFYSLSCCDCFFVELSATTSGGAFQVEVSLIVVSAQDTVVVEDGLFTDG
jgi:hypothetical protein